jgi:LPXTG-motif cell wall-anchored protein
VIGRSTANSADLLAIAIVIAALVLAAAVYVGLRRRRAA